MELKSKSGFKKSIPCYTAFYCEHLKTVFYCVLNNTTSLVPGLCTLNLKGEIKFPVLSPLSVTAIKILVYDFLVF